MQVALTWIEFGVDDRHSLL